MGSLLVSSQPSRASEIPKLPDSSKSSTGLNGASCQTVTVSREEMKQSGRLSPAGAPRAGRTHLFTSQNEILIDFCLSKRGRNGISLHLQSFVIE